MSLLKICVFFWSSALQKERRKEERDLPYGHNGQGWGRLKPWASSWSPKCVRGPSMYVIFCSFSRCISGELNWKGSSNQNTTQCLYEVLGSHVMVSLTTPQHQFHMDIFLHHKLTSSFVFSFVQHSFQNIKLRFLKVVLSCLVLKHKSKKTL